MNTGTRAIWSDVFTDFHSPDDIKRYVDFCVRNEITVSFPCINHVTGATVYPSDVSPRLIKSQNGTSYNDWDPTVDVIKLSKEAGIESHIWVCIANAGRANLGVPGGLEIDKSGPQPLEDVHPEWASVSHNGISMVQTVRETPEKTQFYFLNFCRPEVREYLTKLCCETADRYNADGIHLDYIRSQVIPPNRSATGLEAFNAPEEANEMVRDTLGGGSARFSFDDFTINLYAEETGVDLRSHGKDLPEQTTWLYSTLERREHWYAWKSSKTTDLVKSIKSEMEKRNQKLSAAVFSGYPWCGKEIAQRWPGWVDEKLMDFIVPMDYDLTEDELNQQQLDQNSHFQKEPKPQIPIISGINFKKMKDLTPKETRERIKNIEGFSAENQRVGISFYCYNHFNNVL